jgi:hypothetical protein
MSQSVAQHNRQHPAKGRSNASKASACTCYVRRACSGYCCTGWCSANEASLQAHAEAPLVHAMQQRGAFGASTCMVVRGYLRPLLVCPVVQNAPAPCPGPPDMRNDTVGRMCPVSLAGSCPKNPPPLRSVLQPCSADMQAERVPVSKDLTHTQYPAMLFPRSRVL